MSIEAGDQRPPRIWMFICILAAVAISGAGWMRLSVDSSLEPLLPTHSQARQTILFLRDSSFASKAVLWFRLIGGGSTSDLFAAADAVEQRLDPRLITGVIRPPSEANAMTQALGLLDYADELLGPNDLADLQRATTPEMLRKRMRECYMQLVEPQESFLEQLIRRDPLGVTSRILSRLYPLTKSLGYRVEVRDGHFINSDGRQLILILQTSTTATSLSSSEALVSHLADLCASAPPGIQITPICSQIHTVENQQLMQSDIHRAGVVSSIAFLLLFLSVSRDWRVAAVFLLPVVTTGIAIGWCALVYPKLSIMMIGVAFAMAGSAVDYGIFVYTAVKMGTDPAADLRRIRRPLLISHLTTLGVFVAFIFSKIPAYRQLGYLTSLSLIMSLLAALFVLPKLLKPGGTIVGLGRGIPLQRWGKKMVPVVIVAALLLAAAVVVSRKIKFESDITRLDGVSSAVKQDERDFQKNWERADSELAILVVTGKTRQQAEQANDQLYRAVSPHFSEGQFVSLSSIWPSASVRRANQARWRQFWDEARIATLRQDLAAAAKPYGFSASAFDPFFRSLATPSHGDQPPQIVSSIEEQFVARSNGDWQLLSFFSDTPADIDTVQALLKDRPDAEVVSRGVMTRAFKESAIAETQLLVGISMAFIIVSLLALTRSVIKSLIIMLPVLTGLVAMLAVLEMMSLSMSVVTVVSSIIVLALTSDYGVFALYAWEGRETMLGQGMASVHLSFFTTLAGTGVMIFAKHPALFLVGVSLTSGLVAGYLTAVFVIPGLCFLWDGWKRREAT
jgi:predicted exporter